VYVGRAVAAFVKYLTYSPLRNEMPEYWLASVEHLVFWAHKNEARRQELEYAGDAGLTAMLRIGTLLKSMTVE